jgi:D-3-phosphoglycerate dehydrogenase
VTALLVLDSLFDDLDMEREAARAAGATLSRWDGAHRQLASADAVLHVRTRVHADMIAAMENCRAIGRFGSGLDTVDMDAAAAAGIVVVGVGDYCVPELPTHTLALAFALQRRLGETVLAGAVGANWEGIAAAAPLQRRSTAAVVGLGDIGRRVAAALIALGYRVLAVTRRAAGAARTLGAEVVALDDALVRADMVFLHCALDDSTRGLIDEQRLRLMPRHALLVDTARIGLLDEAAVAAALREGRIGGVALDAALVHGGPLAKLVGDPRLIVSPHIGWYSEQSARALRRRAVVETLAAAQRALGRKEKVT